MPVHLHLDPVGGASGDMILAAFCALGLDLSPLEAALQSIGLPVRLRPTAKMVDDVLGTQLCMDLPGGQPLRHLRDMRAIVETLAETGCVSEAVKTRTMAALRALGEAEAAVHGIALEEVHFHEVGALDTVIDVLGAFWGLEQLSVAGVTCSPLPWFRGVVVCDHGPLPLPAPATLQFMLQTPVLPTAAMQELVTPTGAVLLQALTTRFTTGPVGCVLAHGVAYGTYYVRGVCNGLRAYLYDPTPDPAACKADPAVLHAMNNWFVPSLQYPPMLYAYDNQEAVMKGDHEHRHEHVHEHTHQHEHEHEHPGIGRHSHPHAHTHAHGHVHEHKHPHEHHGQDHTHEHTHEGEHGPHEHEHADHAAEPHDDHTH
ncbi:nickel pincer cofactor biosynthesis protein LarC [Megalodesulfovibrio paquesii]